MYILCLNSIVAGSRLPSVHSLIDWNILETTGSIIAGHFISYVEPEVRAQQNLYIQIPFFVVEYFISCSQNVTVYSVLEKRSFGPSESAVLRDR